MITGWAPVTNMYETVIWVGLVAAVLSFILEMIYRKVFDRAGRLGELGCWARSRPPRCHFWTRASRALQPVLRSNFWLSTHVVCEVSSYAAFALAWMLGLIATVYYLTATYRRSPRLLELALPLLIGVPVCVVRGSGVAASYGFFGPQWTLRQRRWLLRRAVALER